ncbi:tetratricopeptide repeat protein [Streptomyces sp. P9-2]|uniref:tetratricopeptide repeat protein n=1 Tax=Streptomyces sp. P9-2 TaxID=3423201 RepID=UPI003F746E84
MPDAFRDADMPAEFDALVRALEEPVGQRLNPAPVIGDTWRLALDMLEHRGFRYASAVLELLSDFADAPVPYTRVLHVPLLTEQRGFEGIDGSAVWRTLRALAALSLIDFCSGEREGASAGTSEEGPPDSVRVHPLIRDLSRKERSLPLMVTLLGHACTVEQAGKPEEPDTWATWSLLAPHALRLVEQEASLNNAPLEVLVAGAGAAEMAGRYLQARGLSRQAGAVFEKVVEWRLRHQGSMAPDTLTAQHNLAGALHDIGDLTRAEAIYTEVWQGHSAIRGADYPHALTARHELGRVLHDLGRLAEAAEHLSAVLESRRRTQGDEHGHTLSARHELARVLHNLGHWEEARREYRHVLNVRRRSLGDNHPRTLTVLHNLACLAQDEGQLDTALQQFRHVHAARARVLGPAHPQTLSTAYRLGCTLRDAGDASHAKALLQHVHAELSSSLGGERVIVKTCG